MDENLMDFDFKMELMVHQYLLEKGKIIPVSDEEIEFTMNHLQTVPVPKELKNSSFILSNLNKKPREYDKELTNYDVTIAMAARQGRKQLPNEILQQMLNDRKKTENDNK